MTIARSKIMKLIAVECAPVSTERTQREVRAQIGKTFLAVLQLGSSASSTGLKSASVRFIEKIVISLFSCGVADEVMSKCIERWSESNKIDERYFKENGIKLRIHTAGAQVNLEACGRNPQISPDAAWRWNRDDG